MHYFMFGADCRVVKAPTARLVVDGHTHQRLRLDVVEAAAPGLLNAVVRSANREVR